MKRREELKEQWKRKWRNNEGHNERSKKKERKNGERKKIENIGEWMKWKNEKQKYQMKKNV